MLYRVSYWLNRTFNVISSPSGACNASTTIRQLQRRKQSLSMVQHRSFSIYHQSNLTPSVAQVTSHDAQEPDNDTKAPPSRLVPPLASLLNTSSPLHTNLSSFLEHARRVQLTPSTQVFVGTRYEYLAQETLARYGFELLRTGKTGDRGVDLAGWWHLPDVSQTSGTDGTQRLRVLVQCKRLKGKRGLTPAAVRELEGAFLGAPTGWRSKEVLGVMVSTRSATKGIITALSASKKGLVWICLEEHENGSSTPTEAESTEKDPFNSEDDAAGDTATTEKPKGDVTDAYHAMRMCTVYGTVVQMLYNQAARQLGLEGLDVVRRHNLEEINRATLNEITLIYRGKQVREVVSGESQD